ncbi:MAG: helix-turn-helix transcriptional regulator [Clostridia bacterium]|nr:helix-turn-helix transcriptional regulator [Clostridia bacterium]
MENTLIIENVRCGSVQRPRHYRFRNEAFPERDRLILVERGSLAIHGEGKTVCVTEGSFVYLASDAACVTEYTGEENRVLLLWFDRVRGSAEERIRVYPPHPVAAAMAQACFRDARMTQYGLLSSLYGILHHLSQAEPQEGRAAGVGRVVRYIEQSFAEEKKVSEYAAMAYMSESHFRKLFSAAVGMGPIAYRNAMRLRAARELIEEGYTVSEAAEAVGFHSVSFYCRLAAREKREREATGSGK